MGSNVKPTKITDNISYIKASENPLSADIGIAEGEKQVFIFDVGSNEKVLEYINKIDIGSKKKVIVLSHFHGDHISNIHNVVFEKLYVGKETYKHIGMGEIVDEKADVSVNDGEISVQIKYLPNSHCKGALMMTVNHKYTFIGDAIYAKQIGKDRGYNVSILAEQIRILKEIDTEYFCVSHKKKYVVTKKIIIDFLESIYAKRKQGEAYIFQDM